MAVISRSEGTRGCLLYFPLRESSCSLRLNYMILRRTTIIDHTLEKARIASQVHVLGKKKKSVLTQVIVKRSLCTHFLAKKPLDQRQ